MSDVPYGVLLSGGLDSSITSALAKKFASKKFDETLDVIVVLGIDAKKSDQQIRGIMSLPKMPSKKIKIAVFADGDAAEDAKSAGADFIGMDDLSEKFTKNEIAVDVVISTQAAMKVVGKLGQVLGPKGLKIFIIILLDLVVLYKLFQDQIFFLFL